MPPVNNSAAQNIWIIRRFARRMTSLPQNKPRSV
jgi:hypothetical protein